MNKIGETIDEEQFLNVNRGVMQCVEINVIVLFDN